MMVKEEGEKNIEYKNMGGREGGGKREEYGRKERERREENMEGREGGEERKI